MNKIMTALNPKSFLTYIFSETAVIASIAKQSLFIAVAFVAVFGNVSVSAAKAAAKDNGESGGKTRIAYPYYLKRDPFQTFLYSPKSGVSFKYGELPLLRYDISSLKIVGIMQSRGKYYGMIQTPDDRSYIVTIGSPVGINRARVIYINGTEIALRENVYNALGQLRTITVSMKLKDDSN